jgi:hypothetical protein
MAGCRQRAIRYPGAAGPVFGVWRALNPLPAALPAAPTP